MARPRFPLLPRQPNWWRKILLTPVFMAIAMAFTLMGVLGWLEER